MKNEKQTQKNTSQPGVEPGSKVPETLVLPLHHWDIPLGKSPLSIIVKFDFMFFVLFQFS
jgi:hypothetical protein